jgi:phosphate transport system permease protein
MSTANPFKKRKKLTTYLDQLATVAFWILGALVVILIIWLLFTILKNGITKVNWGFLTKLPEEIDAGGGIGPMLFNSFYVLILSLLISLPIGIGAGIYMAEYAAPNKLTEGLRICVEGLASVPSIVFGLIGISIFIEFFHVGLTIIGAAVSLAFLNLPVLTRVTEESIRAVPHEIREAAYALGAAKYQVILTAVLPVATSSIITGVSLVAGRAFGESAVIILTAGLSTSGELWDFNLFAPGETLAVHLWYVQSEAIVADAKEVADKSAAVLLFVVLMINLLFRLPLWIKARRLGK